MKRIKELILVLIILFTVTPAFASFWDIVKLTDNATNDRTPKIDSNGNVAWLGYDSNYAFSDMFFFNESNQSTSRLGTIYSDIRSYGLSPKGDVAWGGAAGVFLYDGEQTKKITSAIGNDVGVNSSGDVTWSAQGLTWNDVYLYRTGGIIRLPNYVDNIPRNDYQVKISDSGKLVWKGDAYNRAGVMSSNIFQYNFVTDDYAMAGNYWGRFSNLPDINSDGQVVFESGDEFNGYNVFFDDGSNVKQITAVPYHGNAPEPRISDNNIAWNEGENIFLYDGEAIRQIADNFQTNLNVSGDLVVWGGSEGGYVMVYLYDGSNVKKIATGTEPYVFGNAITWSGYDGNDWEIYAATPHNTSAVPEPASLVLFGGGLIGISFRRLMGGLSCQKSLASYF